MRDPSYVTSNRMGRIEPMLAALKALWLEQPDLRLGQLICNVARFQVPGQCDLFYVEDDVLLAAIDQARAEVLKRGAA